MVACTAASFALGWASGSAPLMLTLLVSWVLGIVDSTDLPFMRWKRSPLLAASCILAVRAVIVQVCSLGGGRGAGTGMLVRSYGA